MKILVCVKQVPSSDSMRFDERGYLERTEVALEMNPYCRRALAKGTELAWKSSGKCTVVSMGPRSAREMLRGALAWGADEAVLLSDPALAGSDALVTAKALARAVALLGPFDLVLVGRSSVDAETAQVGPQLATLLGLPFAGAAREMQVVGDESALVLRLERDDGGLMVEIDLPAVVSVAERLIQPAKITSEMASRVPDELVAQLGVAQLGAESTWGAPGSETQVGQIKHLPYARRAIIASGTLEEQVDEAVASLVALGALSVPAAPAKSRVARQIPHQLRQPSIAVLLEPGRENSSRELLGRASTLAGELQTEVVALSGEICQIESCGGWGADRAVLFAREPEESGAPSSGAPFVWVEEDVADAMMPWILAEGPQLLLAPATHWGRGIAARIAALTDSGLIADAIDLELTPESLVGWKPSAGGSFVAAITSRSSLKIVTIRGGVLPLPLPRETFAAVPTSTLAVARRGRIRVLDAWRDDDLEALELAEVVIGLGAGVHRDSYGELQRLKEILHAEFAATRKVTDKGWLAHSRQVGITGRSVSPRLYIAIGIQGKFNHTVGFRSAGTVLAINSDPRAPIFDACDVGIVGDWSKVVNLLSERISAQLLCVEQSYPDCEVEERTS